MPKTAAKSAAKPVAKPAAKPTGKPVKPVAKPVAKPAAKPAAPKTPKSESETAIQIRTLARQLALDALAKEKYHIMSASSIRIAKELLALIEK